MSTQVFPSPDSTITLTRGGLLPRELLRNYSFDSLYSNIVIDDHISEVSSQIENESYYSEPDDLDDFDVLDEFPIYRTINPQTESKPQLSINVYPSTHESLTDYQNSLQHQDVTCSLEHENDSHSTVSEDTIIQKSIGNSPISQEDQESSLDCLTPLPEIPFLQRREMFRHPHQDYNGQHLNVPYQTQRRSSAPHVYNRPLLYPYDSLTSFDDSTPLPSMTNDYISEDSTVVNSTLPDQLPNPDFNYSGRQRSKSLDMRRVQLVSQIPPKKRKSFLHKLFKPILHCK
ncbi:hypothetical protein HDV02_002702 [Globomyces sp. JEL0801]|nr:hypothetical protein HDV02_002702 [Globomyces sp. JEL0801]